MGWNARMRTTAGVAVASRWEIWLNPALRGISPHEVERTLLHELAHLLAQHRVGRRRIAPHGQEWRQACQDLGITLLVCSMGLRVADLTRQQLRTDLTILETGLTDVLSRPGTPIFI